MPLGTDQVKPLGTNQVKPLGTNQVKPLDTNHVKPLGTNQVKPLLQKDNFYLLVLPPQIIWIELCKNFAGLQYSFASISLKLCSIPFYHFNMMAVDQKRSNLNG